MTANAFTEDVVNAKNAGMNEHIPKPIDLNKFIRTLPAGTVSAPLSTAHRHRQAVSFFKIVRFIYLPPYEKGIRFFALSNGFGKNSHLL